MAAPIGNTCPNIDKIVKKLDLQMKCLKKFNDSTWEDREYVEGIIDECYSVMEDAVDAFEALRSDNDTLRSWGIDMEEEAESQAVLVAELEEKLQSLA